MYSSPFERGSGGPAMRFYFCFCRERQPTHYSSTVLHTDFDNVDATSWNFILGFASCPHPSPLPKGEGARKFPSQMRGVCFGIQSSAGCRTQIESHALSS